MLAFVIRRLDWYLARIRVHVTPLRVLTWPGSRLDRAPEQWVAPAATVAPPSDPAPVGPALPSRSEPPGHWRPFANRAERLGVPVPTVVGPDGWPLPVRCGSAERTPEGYLLEPPTGVSLSIGPACLTAHRHEPDMSQQENVVLVGTAEPVEDGWMRMRMDRALTDWSLTGSRLSRTLGFLANGKALRPRLEHEAARRGQPAPEVHL